MNGMEKRLVKAALAALDQTKHFDSDIDYAKRRLQEVLGIPDGSDGFLATKYGPDITGKVFYVESPSYEGMATVLGIMAENLVVIKADYTGAIYVIEDTGLVSGGVATE